jgi:glycosyl transferase family 25
VISLDRAIERRAHMTRLAADIGFTAEFVSAVDGRKLSAEQRARYDGPAARRIYGVDMSDSEIGCYLSHFSVFEKMVAENIPLALILEDDIEVDDDFRHIVGELARQRDPEWTVVRFQTSKDCVADGSKPAAKGRRIGRVGGRELFQLQTTVLGGCGYLISLKAAEAMLAFGQRIFLPVDQTLDRYWENGILPYVVRPLPVRQSARFHSEIGQRGRAVIAKPRGWALLRRRMQRWQDSLNKRIFWWSLQKPAFATGLAQLGSRTARIALTTYAVVAAASSVIG